MKETYTLQNDRVYKNGKLMTGEEIVRQLVFIGCCLYDTGDDLQDECSDQKELTDKREAEEWLSGW